MPKTTSAEKALSGLIYLDPRDLEQLPDELLDPFADLALRYAAKAAALLRRRRQDARQAERDRAHVPDMEGADHG